jgi:hypothetical protein
MKRSRATIIIIVFTILIIWGVSRWMSGGAEWTNNPFGDFGDETQQGIPVGEDNAGVVQEITNPSTSLRVNKYTHQDPVFSFEYPKEFSIGSFKDANGETVLVQDSSQTAKKSFQIYITPQDEYFLVTKERIAQDVPETVVLNSREVSIGSAKGLAFTSKDQSGSATREVWFTNGSYLYQITGYPEGEGVIGEMLGTWRFE